MLGIFQQTRSLAQGPLLGGSHKATIAAGHSFQPLCGLRNHQHGVSQSGIPLDQDGIGPGIPDNGGHYADNSPRQIRQVLAGTH